MEGGSIFPQFRRSSQGREEVNSRKPDWDPPDELMRGDNREIYDRLREVCPVAYSDSFGWSVFRHQDVVEILLDPSRFSNSVSRRISIPNGLDPPEHTVYRKIIDRYFEPKRMQEFESCCRDLARNSVQILVAQGNADAMEHFARPFAAEVQCAFLDWPSGLRDILLDWMARSREATRSLDRKAMEEVARQFEGYVREILAERRKGPVSRRDVTASLLNEKVNGRPLSEEELVSILRNWTAGEVGTIAASIGILVHFLATERQWTQKLRAQSELIPPVIDEVLRIDGPLVANRRVTCCPVKVGGREIGPTERLSINWIAANRDSAVFPEPDRVRLDRDPEKNLLFGAGIHVCPGAPLARLELRLVVEELLAQSRLIELSEQRPVRAVYPASGYESLPVQISPV